MNVNLRGFLRNISSKRFEPLIQEFLDNIKELRDDPSKHKEFFDLYLLPDDKEYRNKLKESEK